MARGKGNASKDGGAKASAPEDAVVEVSSAARQRMIAEAAYFRAQARGFRGDPVEDWLAAEAEIDRALSPPSKQ